MRTVIMISFTSILFDSRIQREAIALKNAGYSVRIISIEDQKTIEGIGNYDSLLYSFNKRMEGVNVSRMLLKSRSLSRFSRSISYITQFLELNIKFIYHFFKYKADIVHFHDLHPFFIARMYSGLMRAKLVYDAHEDELSLVSSTYYRFFMWYESRACRVADLVITVNRSIAEIMSSRYNADVKVIANRPEYIAMDMIKPMDLKKEFSLPAGAKVLMYVGNVAHKVRGIEVIAESLSGLGDEFYFLIMGVGRLNEFKIYLTNYLANKGIPEVAERIIFIGPFQSNEIIDYLNAADVSTLIYQDTVFDNAKSNAPNKFYQSVMARTPVLANHNLTFPKLVYHDEFGQIGETVRCDDVEAVIEAINRLVKPQNQQDFRKNEELMSKSISWEYEAEKLVGYYSNI